MTEEFYNLCTILSELYVDNERDRTFLVKKLNEINLPAEEIESTLFKWVHPTLYYNLTGIPGEWMGWTQAEIKEMVDEFSKKKWKLYKLDPFYHFVKKDITREWTQIKALLNH